MRYEPTWEGPIEGYATNQVHRNLWRVASTHDRDDLMQEARLVFLRCAARYEVEEARHFMALYKSALTRRMHDLANKASRVPASANLPEDWHEQESVGDTENAGYLRTLIRQAPPDVRLVLSFFVNAPDEMVKSAERAWSLQNRGREDFNTMVRNLLGPAAGQNPHGAVTSYLLG